MNYKITSMHAIMIMRDGNDNEKKREKDKM